VAALLDVLASTLEQTPLRTNIFIDDRLIAKAMRASGTASKREVVELGLKTLVRLNEQEQLRSGRGKLRWEGDLEPMRLDRRLPSK
jgi:Arc/MetJ family transcription regulator